MDTNQPDNFEDNFLLSNLPSCDEMLQKIMPNKDMLYYPPSSGQLSYLKAFDFFSQKSMAEEDEFISIDSHSTTNTQAKAKTKQKKTQSYSTTQKTKQAQTTQQKNAYQNTYAPAPPKFKITQTINPENNWKIIADFNKHTLEKLKIDDESKVEVEDKAIVGTIYHLNEDLIDKISPYNVVPLTKYENLKFFGTLSTCEDDKLKNADFANVFVTDKILSVIMTSVYQSHPWHLKVTKLGDNIIIDKTETSQIDLVTVNESDSTPSDEDDKNINGYKKLNIEATLINEFIKEQLVDTDTKIENVDGPNPFIEQDMDENEIEHLGYRYRLWNVEDMKIIVRCQVHSFIEKDIESEEESLNEEEEDKKDTEKKPKEEKKIEDLYDFINIYALNEYDKNTYLTKESNIIPTLMKKELQNNHLKLTKWGVCCYLAGVKDMKIGFVTRKNVKENDEHVISGFYSADRDDFLKIAGFNKAIAWGIVKEIIDIIRRDKNDGQFIIMKTLGATGAKSMLKLYKIPDTLKSE